MQKKQIGGIIVLLVVGLFLGNWIYGNVLSAKIEERLIERIKDANTNITVVFNEIIVNPLFSKIKLEGFIIDSKSGKNLVKGKHVELDMPYAEAIQLLKSKRFEEVKSFRVKLKDIEVYVEDIDNKLIINNLTLDFKGHLTQHDFKNINSVFPVKKQAVKFVANGMRFAETPWMHALGFTEEQIKDYNQVDKLLMELRFSPNKKVFVLEDLYLDSPIITYKSKGHISYSGDGIEGVTPVEIGSSIDLKLNDNGIEWGDPKKSGRYSLNNLRVKMDGVVEQVDGVRIIKSQNSDILMKEFKLEYAGDKKNQMEAKTALFGIEMDELSIELLTVQTSLKDNILSIKNTKLSSVLLNADLNAEIEVDSANFTASEIVKGKLILSNLFPGLQNGLSTLELMTGQSLPRQGNNIIIEMSGPVSRPNIKGLKY